MTMDSPANPAPGTTPDANPGDTPPGDANPGAISPTLIAELKAALDLPDEKQSSQLLKQITAELHVADLAEITQVLPLADGLRLLLLHGDDLEPDCLPWLPESTLQAFAATVEAKRMASLLQTLDSDDVVGVLEELNEKLQQAILAHMPQLDASFVSDALAYPEESVGRLMQKRVAVAPTFWTVGQAIDFMRDPAHDLPERFHELILVDATFRPKGQVPVSLLLRSTRDTQLLYLERLGADMHMFPVQTDRELAVRTFRRYGLIEAPVIDDKGRLLGVLSLDDMIQAQAEELTEDLLGLAQAGQGQAHEGPIRTGLRRTPWLLANLLTGILVSILISQFEDQIVQVVALAILMPVAASLAGNSGVQAMTVSVVDLMDARTHLRQFLVRLLRETLAGALNGLLIGVGFAMVAGVWFGQPALVLVAFLGPLLAIPIASAIGTMVPYFLRKWGFDPAISSPVIVTVLADLCGFAVFLTAGKLWVVP